jgi:hypothetical protein
MSNLGQFDRVSGALPPAVVPVGAGLQTRPGIWEPRDAEVHDFDDAVAADQDPLWLEVTMDHTLRVRLCKPRDDLPNDSQPVANRKRVDEIDGWMTLMATRSPVWRSCAL